MRLRTHHVLMLFLLTMVLAGNCFLTSAGRGEEEGAVPWSADSILRPLVEALNLGYGLPTPLGVEIKTWVFGAGTGVAMLIAVIGWYLSRAPAQRPADEPGARPTGPTSDNEPTGIETVGKRLVSANMSAWTGAQLLFLIVVVYSLLSANWSFAPEFSLGGSAVLGAQVFWALALARGLNRHAARIAARVLMAVCVLTAGLAVWYFYERNPHFRAKYPIGNPLFLAAVLIPGILLSLGELMGRVRSRAATGSGSLWVAVPVCVLALVVLVWCFSLTGARPPTDAGILIRLKTLLLAGSRASLIGLAIGGLAVPFFLLGKRGKVVLTLVTAGLVVCIVAVMIPRWQEVTEFGRGATVRLRLYAWSYALRMVEQRSLTGAGQGAYALLADRAEFAGRDAVADPLAMQGRLSHAHNEWIETWADLGTLGLAFVAVAYLLTFLAGSQALARMSAPSDRWCLAGLLGGLLGLGVEEFAAVGLRVPGLPAMYFTILGLVWAMCSPGGVDDAAAARPVRPAARKGILSGVIVLALVVIGLFARDWTGARAQYDAAQVLGQSRFDAAVEAAECAARSRLEPSRRLEAKMQLLETYARVARAFVDRAGQRVRRLQAGEIDEELAARLIKEDLQLAAAPMRQGLALAEYLRGFVPGLAGLGSTEADLCALLAERARYQEQEESIGQLRLRAVEALKNELQRHGFDEDLVLRYLTMAVGIPVGEQLAMLCGPLRGGAVSSALYTMSEQLTGQESFKQMMQTSLNQANRDLQSGDPSKWKNPFSPEVCRLVAALEGRQHRYDRAIELCAKAVELYAQGKNRELLSLCRAQTLLSQGWYAFLANPSDPGQARARTQQALETVPPIGKAPRYRAPMYSQLVTLCLAADDEAAARSWASRGKPGLDSAALDVLIGQHYALVAELFMLYGLPAAEARLESARKLAPDSLRVRWVRVRWLFENGRYEETTQELGWLMERDDPQRVAAFLQSALTQHPEAEPLRTLYDHGQAAGRLPPMPATTMPASQPATAPGLAQPDRNGF